MNRTDVSLNACVIAWSRLSLLIYVGFPRTLCAGCSGAPHCAGRAVTTSCGCPPKTVCSAAHTSPLTCLTALAKLWGSVTVPYPQFLISARGRYQPPALLLFFSIVIVNLSFNQTRKEIESLKSKLDTESFLIPAPMKWLNRPDSWLRSQVSNYFSSCKMEGICIKRYAIPTWLTWYRCIDEYPQINSLLTSLWGDMAQEVRAVVWQSEGCQFDPTLGVSKCPWARHLTPNRSWRAGWYLARQPIAVGVWMCVWMGEWVAYIVQRFG